MIAFPEGMTPVEVAAALKVNPQTVRGWIRMGKLRAFRVGGRLHVRPEEVRRFVERGMAAEEVA